MLVHQNEAGCCAIGDEQYNEPHVSCAQSDIESITITTPLEGGAQGSLHTQLSTQLRKQTCISLSTRVQSLLRARCCESLSFKSPNTDNSVNLKGKSSLSFRQINSSDSNTTDSKLSVRSCAYNGYFFPLRL